MDRETILNSLRASRDLIKDPNHWTQEAYARNEYGDVREAEADDAVRFCSMGALDRQPSVYMKFANRDGVIQRWRPIHFLNWAKAFNEGITTFNDKHTHAEVMAAWDAAIKKLESIPEDKWCTETFYPPLREE
jgi:hypothetical protein